ncbi:MAG: ComEA family DNA-binding protein, partial [Betaproteobacteria bacterium]|nr:ComEA family DNA-binding protein [Betaproteobacteria bacterium]
SEPAGASEARRLTETASTCTIGLQSSSASGGRKLDLNAATVAELDALPGIGQVLASRIIAWRTAHRGFTNIHELQEVEGIGPAKFARLSARVEIR